MNAGTNDTAEMPFLDHLGELRECLAFAIVAIAAASVACFLYADGLFAFLTAPAHDYFGHVEMIGTGPAEAFIVKIKVAIFAGFVFSAPASFYQLWRFVKPALHAHERRYAFPFVVITTLFFLTGAGFCFYVVLPYAFQFFAGEFSSIGVAPTLRIGEYLSFATKMVLIFGAVFELPIVTFFLARLGLVSAPWLASKGRYAVVVIFVVAAILTPPDVATQVFLAIPLVIIYGICIGVAHLFGKKADASSATSTPAQ